MHNKKMISIMLQGILEAFPISSSLHLSLFKIQDLSIMHLGTGIAFFLYTILNFKISFTKPISEKTVINIFKIILLTIPTIFIGYYIKKQPYTLNPYLINLIFGIIMLYANQLDNKRKFNSLKLWEITSIALFMAFSLLPGASRLGTTFTAFRLFKLSQEESFIYSIILGIPITLGAATLTIATHGTTTYLTITSLTAGFLTYHTLKITQNLLNLWNYYSFYRITFSIIQLYYLSR